MVGFGLCIPAGQKNPSKNEERLYSKAYSGNVALTMGFLYQEALGEEYVIHHTLVFCRDSRLTQKGTTIGALY